MSLYTFYLGQIISTVLGQVDHGGQHGNAARTITQGETPETDHAQNHGFRHSAICQTMKAFVMLRCLHGSEMVLLGVVIGTTHVQYCSKHTNGLSYFTIGDLYFRFVHTETDAYQW